MKILRWLAYLLPDIAMSLAAFVVVPVAVYFRNGNRLPRWARWFETEDNDIWGDDGHYARWANVHGYWKAVAWLWRNRAYYFGSRVIGAKTIGPVEVRGNPAVSNRPYVPGWCLRTTPEGYWQLYVIKGWGRNRLVRLNLGWKLWGSFSHPNFGQFVFALNPWAKRG